MDSPPNNPPPGDEPRPKPVSRYLAPEPVLPPGVEEGSWSHEQYKQFLNPDPKNDYNE